MDLLLLHDGWARRNLEELVRALCYPLWDAGLAVGHAVHTPRDAVRAAADRLETATALTDRRLVAGDRGLLDELAVRCTRWLRRAGGELLAALDRSDGARAGMLEPDLKSGVGGLRDLHALRWASAGVLGEPGLDPLVGARYLGAAERGELARAGATLLAARCALHLVARGDCLRLDLQDEVASRLGLTSTPAGAPAGAALTSGSPPAGRAAGTALTPGSPPAAGASGAALTPGSPPAAGAALTPADELLRRVGLAMRTVAHLHGRTWPRLVADARGGRRRRRAATERLDDGVVLVDGLVEVEPGRTLAADCSLGLRAVAAAAARGTHLGRASATALRREVDMLGQVGWDDGTRTALLATLRAGDDARRALGDADQIGLLSAHLPGWRRIRGHPQRNPFHRYDLDTHALEACAELVRIADGALDPGHAQLWDDLADPDALLLGALLHDIGKAWPGDHSVAGARVAREWLRTMGYGARRADHVARLVRWHLLLPDVATGVDLDDTAELTAVTRRIGDRETLDGLYLLSLADARATGPSAWSAWKDTLLAELHARLRRVLTRADPRPRDRRPDAVIAGARRLLGDEVGALDALLGSLPWRYLPAADAEQLAEHARLLCPLPGPGTLRARVRPGPADGTQTLSLVAADRPGLMADCAGVLAAHGVTVLDARAFTRDDGVALDWFVVRPGEHVDWSRVVADLQRAAGADLDVGTLVARREQRRDARAPVAGLPAAVAVRLDRGLGLTRVEVRAPDAPGVLYRLARVLADAGLDVVGARVTTLGPEVRDVFHVRPAGDPPDPRALEAGLRAAASAPPG